MKRDARRRFRLCDEEWDDDEEEWDEDDELEDDGGHVPEVEGPSYAPVFTGLLKANGEPILRHPIVMRMGFHPEDRKYHCPTLEDNGFDEEDGRVFGWVYD